MKLIRIRDAAAQLGYSPRYAHEVIPRLLPVFRVQPNTPNAPLCVREEDLIAYLARITAEPVSEPGAAA